MVSELQHDWTAPPHKLTRPWWPPAWGWEQSPWRALAGPADQSGDHKPPQKRFAQTKGELG